MVLRIAPGDARSAVAVAVQGGGSIVAVQGGRCGAMAVAVSLAQVVVGTSAMSPSKTLELFTDRFYISVGSTCRPTQTRLPRSNTTAAGISHWNTVKIVLDA